MNIAQGEILLFKQALSKQFTFFPKRYELKEFIQSLFLVRLHSMRFQKQTSAFLVKTRSSKKSQGQKRRAEIKINNIKGHKKATRRKYKRKLS